MATYDRNLIPILNFHSPAGAIYYPKEYGILSYPMGNTRKRSITEQIGTAKDQHLDLLLLGCGDIRNLLCTVSELSQRKTKHRPKSVHFHLNDYDALILPRDAILLEIASNINPNSTDDVDFLWNVWNNMCLSERHYQRLKQVIQSLQDRHFEDEDSMIQFKESKTEQECRAVWKDWSQLDLDVNKVKQERAKFVKKSSTSNEDIRRHILKKLAVALCSRNTDFLPESSLLHEEVRHWASEASTTDDADHTNPTIIRPFEHNWQINFNASPFEGYMPFTIPDIERCKSLTEVCKETLASWIKRFQQFKQTHPVKVFLWCGDCLGLCTSGFPKDLLFDVIDTSNVSDHSGLLNVIVCCAPRLKRPGESVLTTSSMLCWGGRCKNMEDYYNKCIGIDTNMLPTILGVHLAVDLDLGDRKIPDDWEETLHWVKASTSRTKLTIDKESDVITALWNLTKRCFKLIADLEEARICGVVLSSPLTLLRIIHQLDPLIEGGASRIMDLLENELPYDFHQEHGFSWKLVKSIAVRDNEPVVQVSAKLRLQPSDSLGEQKKISSTPIVIFMSSYTDLLSRFTGCPVLHNSIRFNVKDGHVTFHLLEKDWENVRTKMLLYVVLDQKIKLPTFDHRPISLRNESLFDVKQVDPVDTFGLFAVQEFDVVDGSSSLLQLIKLEEEDDSYYAELAILDLDKCKAKDMKVEFSPESIPTQIQLKFHEKNQSTLWFSCPVNSSSKFQLSKKNAKIVCNIKKKDNFVTGEMTLVNPAQVPFHVMTAWNPKEDDIEWTFAKMFRDDGVAKREVGPPFREVRRLFLTIFRELIDKKLPIAFEIGVAEPEQTIIIKLFGPIHKWNNLPYAKCIFHELKPNPLQDIEDFLALVPLGPELAGCTQSFNLKIKHKELEMLRRILHINAARTEQVTRATPDWTDSFISPVCARETNYNQRPASLMDVLVMDSLVDELIGTGQSKNKHPDEEEVKDTSQKTADQRCSFCQKESPDLKKCTACKQVYYCDKDCQMQHWKQGHKDVCIAPSSQRFPQDQTEAGDNVGIFTATSEEPKEIDDHCAFCRMPSENLKLCTRCKKVSYCDKFCQKQHWKEEHKDVCSTWSSIHLSSQQDELEIKTKVSLEFVTKNINRCGFCRKVSSSLKECTGCKMVSYCNNDCQRQHWLTGHKDVCNAMEQTPEAVSEDLPSYEQSEPPNNLCYSCQKAWKDMKNCPNCKKETYCDKASQTSLW